MGGGGSGFQVTAPWEGKNLKAFDFPIDCTEENESKKRLGLRFKGNREEIEGQESVESPDVEVRVPLLGSTPRKSRTFSSTRESYILRATQIWAWAVLQSTQMRVF